MKQEQDLRYAIYWADRDLWGLFLSFPISTFGAALLIGLWNSLPAMRTPSDAPLWILLSVCVLLAALGMSSVRWARRGYVEAGMPQHAIQRRISGMWSISAILMIVAGGCVFGYIAMSLMRWDPSSSGPWEAPSPAIQRRGCFCSGGTGDSAGCRNPQPFRRFPLLFSRTPVFAGLLASRQRRH